MMHETNAHPLSSFDDGAPAARSGPAGPDPTATGARAHPGKADAAPPPRARLLDARPGAVDEIHLMDHVRTMYKRRWLGIAAFTVVFGSIVIYSFTATPIYEARTQLLIENDNPNVVSFEEVMDQNKTTADYYQTQYRLLQSRAVAKLALDASNLWGHPQFAGAGEQRSWSLRRWARSWLANGAPAAEPPEGDRQSRAIETFLRSLTITPVKNSRLVDIRFSSPDPRVATSAANGLARAFIDQNLELRFLATKEASDFLGQQMAEQRKVVESNEVALQRYREMNDAVSLEDRQNIVVQRLADLNAAVTRARTERIEKEAMYNQIRSIQSNRAALDTIPAIVANRFIQDLKTELASLQRQEAQLGEKLGERHPDMVKVRSAIQNTQQKLQAEVAKILQATRTEYQAAVEQERSLIGALDQQKAEAMALNRQAIEYGVLQRDAAASRQLYDGLLQRTKETGIAGELKSSNIRVTDVAEVPRRPARPNKRNNLALGIFVGLFVAVGLIFLFEYLDSRIKAPEEVKAQLGLPFLGIIPELSQRNVNAGVRTVADAGVAHDFVEAFRTLRTSVLFGFPDEGCKTVVVTSTGPGEGKTAVSANLAISLAQAGQRVLLIDADMRRPTAHELLGCNQEPGLSNVIVGDRKAADSVQRLPESGLWFLSAGKIPPNPAELLASKRFQAFMSTLKDHFEWIVIDSPPVLPVADAAVVAHSASGVVFVVGSEMTARSAARTALEQLDAANARYLGAVLNKVQLTRHAYYYSRYYRRDYAGYYVSPVAD